MRLGGRGQEVAHNSTKEEPPRVAVGLKEKEAIITGGRREKKTCQVSRGEMGRGQCLVLPST